MEKRTCFALITKWKILLLNADEFTKAGPNKLGITWLNGLSSVHTSNKIEFLLIYVVQAYEFLLICVIVVQTILQLGHTGFCN